MKKKYIIALEDRNVWSCGFPTKTLLLSDVSIFGTDLASVNTGIELTPYTEPDLEQVRKEAYEEGKKQAKVQAELDVCHDIEKVAKENYKAGLADAWEAARKIANLVSGEQRRLFDCFGIYPIACRFSAHEAIEKLKTYEQEQEEIKVGDEVERILDGEVDSKAVFLEEDKGYYHCLFWTGRFFTTLSYPKKQFRKTGRHFPEIAAVLEKMRGEQE